MARLPVRRGCAIAGELVEGGQLYLMASPKVAHPGKKKDK